MARCCSVVEKEKEVLWNENHFDQTIWHHRNKQPSSNILLNWIISTKCYQISLCVERNVPNKINWLFYCWNNVKGAWGSGDQARDILGKAKEVQFSPPPPRRVWPELAISSNRTGTLVLLSLTLQRMLLLWCLQPSQPCGFGRDAYKVVLTTDL